MAIYEGMPPDGHLNFAERIFTKIKNLFDTKVQTDVPANAIFTDEKVTQTESTTDENYEVLVSGTASTVTTIEGVNKSEGFKYNPNKHSVMEGQLSKASGQRSHAEGYYTSASNYNSHSEGQGTLASGSNSHSEGYYAKAIGVASHAEGNYAYANGDDSHAEGCYTYTNGSKSHAEGYYTTTKGKSSHSEGYKTLASGSNSHAEGSQTTSSGEESHSEGIYSYASGNHSHAEGYYTCAAGYIAHAEGEYTRAEGSYSHTEGYGTYTTNTGSSSHAEGTYTTVSGENSHAEGYHTYAQGKNSHAQGQYTTASHISQFVFGEYNMIDASTATSRQRGNYVEIVGNGLSSTQLSNARTLDWNGNEWVAAGLSVDGLSSTTEGETSTTVQTSFARLQNNSFTLSDTTDTITPSETEGEDPTIKTETHAIEVTPEDIILNDTWDGSRTSLKEAVTFLGSQSAANKVDKAGDTMTGNLNLQNTSVDASKTNNGVSSIQYPTSFHILDNEDRTLARMEAVINPNGNIGSYWYVRNYNTSGGQVAQKGIAMHMNKSGTLSYSVSDGEAFATAIGKYARSSIGTLDWGSNNEYLLTKSAIAYWNGCYSGTTSNLQYCNKGAFGTIVTKNTGDYLPVTGGTLTGGLRSNVNAIGETAIIAQRQSVTTYMYANSDGRSGIYSNKGLLMELKTDGTLNLGGNSTHISGTHRLKFNNQQEIYNNEGYLILGTSNMVCVRTYNNINAAKTIQAASFQTYSSRLIKKNITDITQDEAKSLLNLRVVDFDYIEQVGGQTNQTGIIAEEALTVYPKCVDIPENYNEDEVKKAIETGGAINAINVDYTKLIAPLIKLVQMQQKEIDDLKAAIKTS